MSPPRPLVIGVLDAGPAMQWAERLAGVSERIQLRPAPIGWRELRPWLASTDPDLVAASGECASFALLARLRLAGWGVVMPVPTGRRLAGRWRRLGVLGVPCEEPADAADRCVAGLARLGGVPGAGLSGGPPVSVVTTVRDEAANVDRLLADVIAQLRADDEFVVVDGGSRDATMAQLARRAAGEPRLRVLAAPGTNISAGRNHGIRAARHDVIACTDAGCVPDAGWLEALRRPFAEAERPGLVAGVPRVVGVTALERAQALACYPHPAEARRSSALVRLHGLLFGVRFDPALPFARSLAFTRQAWERAGGFPERLGWVEDGVFGRQIAAAGLACLLAAEATVSWQQRGSWSQTARMYHRYGIGAAESGDRMLVARDLVRVVAYVGGLGMLLVRPRRAALVLGAGGGLYLSLPVRRAVREQAGAAATLAIPVALATKDLGKVSGAVSVLARRWGAAK
ncbi:MAG: glycosyltransferase [Mycobacteriales bacterium]